MSHAARDPQISRCLKCTGLGLSLIHTLIPQVSGCTPSALPASCVACDSAAHDPQVSWCTGSTGLRLMLHEIHTGAIHTLHLDKIHKSRTARDDERRDPQIPTRLTLPYHLSHRLISYPFMDYQGRRRAGGAIGRARREMVNLSLANRFGPNPPFRVVTDCKANVKLCTLLPSCSPRCPDKRELIIRVTIGFEFGYAIDTHVRADG
jgi:hypothetical protein